MGIKRVAHRITPNTASTRPQYMVFLDTETGIERDNKGRTTYPFRLGHAHYWRRRRDNGRDVHDWADFQHPMHFWEWLDAHTMPKTVTYLVAHNILFDLAALDWLPYLELWGWECKWPCDNGQVRIYRYRKGDKTLLMLDNCNFFKGKLEDWAGAVGLPKIPVDFELATVTELFKHCRRDVRIMVELWDWWLRFLDDHDLGTFMPTLAGQSMAAYRHRFMEFPVYVHANKQALELERASYRGGRVECFRVGKFTDGPFYQLDINSMYPYIMRKYEYPNNLRDYGGGMPLHWLEHQLGKFGFIAKCELNVTEPWFPVRRNGRNVYPVGQFVTTLTTEEIRLALARGWLLHVGRWAQYTMRPLFDSFVDYFYPLKQQYEQEGNQVLRRLIKDMLNLLHGKFGQRGTASRKIGVCDPSDNKVVHVIDRASRKRHIERYMGGVITEELREGEAFNSVPSIAAHVAANARLELYKLVRQSGDNSCYYCDTDSLIVNWVGVLLLPRERFTTDLGGLKWEGTADTLTINAPKDYVFGSKIVVKGVGDRAKWIGENEAIVEHWPGLNTYLKSGRELTYATKRVLKHLSRTIQSGHVGEDGWVHPFVYPEDRE